MMYNLIRDRNLKEMLYRHNYVKTEKEISTVFLLVMVLLANPLYSNAEETNLEYNLTLESRVNHDENLNHDIIDLAEPYVRNLTWYPVKKEKVRTEYDSWKSAGASTESGGVLKASHSNKGSNSYSGQLKVPVNAMNIFVGFNISRSFTKEVGYETVPLPNLSGKGHRLEYRNSYSVYKVTQEKNMIEELVRYMISPMFTGNNGKKEYTEL